MQESFLPASQGCICQIGSPANIEAARQVQNSFTNIGRAIADTWNRIWDSSEGKSRNKPPEALPEAEGRPHSIPERSGEGPEGQYTTHNGDGTSKQYRGKGQDHGSIPRPNVKETKLNTTPDGQTFVDKGRVRPPTPDEIPKEVEKK